MLEMQKPVTTTHLQNTLGLAAILLTVVLWAVAAKSLTVSLHLGSNLLSWLEPALWSPLLA